MEREQMNIRIKLMIWFSLFGIIPSILIGLYYGYQSQKSIETKVMNMSISSAKQTSQAINDRIESIEKTLYISIQNEYILETIDELAEQNIVDRMFDERNIAKHFNAVVFNQNYIKSVVLLLNSSESANYMYGEIDEYKETQEYIQYFTKGKFKNSKLFSDLSSYPNKMTWAIINTGTENYICLLKKFSYFLYARELGTVVYTMKTNIFDDFIMEDQEGMTITICDKFNRNVLTGKESTLNRSNNKIKNIYDDITVEENDNTFCVSVPLKNGWSYINEIDKAYLNKDIKNTTKHVIMFVLVCSSFFITLAIGASVSIGNRMRKLIKKFKRVEKGDLTVEVELKGKDELKIIEDGFNGMLVRLKKIIEQNYIYKLEKRDAQLSALQYQINPHFLYNVLEIINSTAITYQAKDIQEITQSLAKLYRYNISSTPDKAITLQDEIDHIKNYFYIQKVQMSDQLQVFYNLDEEGLGCEIIKFILQPIVENCIKHGFHNKSDYCCIELNSFIENQVLYIEICDDGVGISNENLCKLNNKLESSVTEYSNTKGGGIGLKNVHDRLKLKYGEAYGLVIHSQIGMGTTVTLRIPIK